ncbi:MAG: nucleoside-diphosphate kinase [Planctomycetaceae bacterium]|jgi:nucleoside-diphosphate kinase
MASQRTLILVKPDGVHRRLIGQIISRIENKGLSIVAMKMLQVTPELSKKHYAEHVAKPFYPQLEEFITAAPVVAMIVQGPEAVAVMRTIIGATNGREAAPGTIRGDYGCSRQMNMIHGSDSAESASREIDIYFSANEICNYSPALHDWSFAADEV